MNSEQRQEIESRIRRFYQTRETYLACGDVEQFNKLTAQIANLERELRDTTNRKEE